MIKLLLPGPSVFFGRISENGSAITARFLPSRYEKIVQELKISYFWSFNSGKYE